MPSTLRANVIKGGVALVLLLIGLVCVGLFRVISANGHQVYDSGAVPPKTVHVTVGNTYDVAVPGGVPALISHGIAQLTDASGNQVPGLQCEWSKGGAESQTLSVDAEQIGTKAVNTVGHFVAPVTGNLHIDCTHWGTMFVPNADNASGDSAGGFLVVGTLTLTVGAALGLSALRVALLARAGSRRAAAEDDEVDGGDGLVRSGRFVGGDDEISAGGDVRP